MTEEIIIDGVNVWSCKHYDLENNYCDQSYLGEGGLLKNTKNPKRCEGSPNCYYKQLKRLEQENKELKEKVKSRENELANMAEQANIRINTYRSALEEIRTYLNTLSSIDNDFPNTETYLRIQDKINEVLK